MFFLIIILIGSAVIMFSYALIPLVSAYFKKWTDKKEKVMLKELDNMFYNSAPKKMTQLYYILPLAFGAGGFLLTRSIVPAFLGAVLGLFIPNFMIKLKAAKRRIEFNQQILDAIMILSSSLKGGLSLLQALEVLVEEMPAPMNQEIGLVVRENKMGIRLEDALKHLNDRMKLEELTLVINSILVARETGGDLTKVFSRLTTTIRDNRKLKDNIRTLTLQGRMQGIIMSVLPFVFIWWVLTFNKHHFDVMLKTDTGKTLLFAAIILQMAGMILIRKFSTIKI
ncbi:MAG: type II secretion system F family protein [Candidatus Omnitrophota bacterium]